MEWSIWWRIDSEKRAFCSNYMHTFRSFSCIKNDIKIDKITIVVHELYFFSHGGRDEGTPCATPN
jgi:hypothetical protein